MPKRGRPKKIEKSPEVVETSPVEQTEVVTPQNVTPCSKETKKQTDAIESKIKNDFGNVLVSFREYAERPDYIIRTIPAADILLNGGLRTGRHMLISGKPSVGKTTLSLYFAKKAYEQYGCPIYYFKVEGRLDKGLVKSIGITEDYKFSIIESTQDRILFSKDYLQMLIDMMKGIRSGFYIFDSLSMLLPQDEYEGGMSGSTMMQLGRDAAKFFRTACNLVYPTNSTIIFIVHEMAIRSTGMPGAPTSGEGGGNAVKFENDLHLSCWTGDKYKDSETGYVFGHDIHAKIKKISWASTMWSEFVVPIRYGKGIDEERSILDSAQQFGIINRSGASYSYNGEKLGHGLENTINVLRENTKIRDGIKEKISAMAFG
jgi:recombination protein RecA